MAGRGELFDLYGSSDIPNPYNGGVFDIRQRTDNLSGPYSQTGMIYYSSETLDQTRKQRVAQAVLQITVVTYTWFALATAVLLIDLLAAGLVLFAAAEVRRLALAEQVAMLEAAYAAASVPAAEAPAAAVELGQYLSAQQTPVGVNLVFSAVLEDKAFVTIGADDLHASPTQASQPTILSDAPIPTPTTLGGTYDPRLGPIAQQAEAAWGPGDGNRTPSIDFVVAPLPAGLLAESVVTSWDAQGRPVSGVVFLSPDADGAGWYIVPSVTGQTSFGQSLSATASAALLGSAADGHYVLLTTLEHEIGHILAFDPSNPGYESHLQTVDGSQFFVGAGFSVQVAPDGELDPSLYPDDVMDATLAPGVRELPSPLDMEVVGTLWGTQPTLPGQSTANLATVAGVTQASPTQSVTNGLSGTNDTGTVTLAVASVDALKSATPTAPAVDNFTIASTTLVDHAVAALGNTTPAAGSPLSPATAPVNAGAATHHKRRHATVELHHAGATIGRSTSNHGLTTAHKRTSGTPAPSTA